MTEVFGNHAQRIEKRMLGKLEPDAMLGTVDVGLRGVPYSKLDIDMYILPYFYMGAVAALFHRMAE